MACSMFRACFLKYVCKTDAETSPRVNGFHLSNEIAYIAISKEKNKEKKKPSDQDFDNSTSFTKFHKRKK